MLIVITCDTWFHKSCIYIYRLLFSAFLHVKQPIHLNASVDFFTKYFAFCPFYNPFVDHVQVHRLKINTCHCMHIFSLCCGGTQLHAMTCLRFLSLPKNPMTYHCMWFHVLHFVAIRAKQFTCNPLATSLISLLPFKNNRPSTWARQALRSCRRSPSTAPKSHWQTSIWWWAATSNSSTKCRAATFAPSAAWRR